MQSGKIYRDDTLIEIYKDVKTPKQRSKWKKYVTYTFNLWFRLLSLVDIVTDLILLYKVMSVDDPDKKIMPLAVALFVSIISPYILSYSSGVKLGMNVFN